jgi:hypothetical protein
MEWLMFAVAFLFVNLIYISQMKDDITFKEEKFANFKLDLFCFNPAVLFDWIKLHEK